MQIYSATKHPLHVHYIHIIHHTYNIFNIIMYQMCKDGKKKFRCLINNSFLKFKKISYICYLEFCITPKMYDTVIECYIVYSLLMSLKS